MRPNGIVSRSTAPFAVEIDFEAGRNKSLLRKFLLGVRSRFEGKAGPGKRRCCHKSLAGLGILPFAFGQVTVVGVGVGVGVGVVGSIQHVPAHNKLCITNHPRNRSDQPQTIVITSIRLLLTLEPGTHT